MPRNYVTPKGQNLTFAFAIGSGQFGSAFAVRNRKNDVYCLKEVCVRTSDEDAKALVLKEVQMMQAASHPNVVAFYDSWFERNRLCILMEFCPNGSLDKLIQKFKVERKRFTECKVLHFLQELASALAFCHDHGIIHRDVKPANVCMDSIGTLKLTDFGMSKVLNNDHLCATMAGTPLYMAPEVCKGEGYSHPADVWALGCLAFELMAFRSPFTSNGADVRNIMELNIRIASGKIDYTGMDPSEYSDTLHNTVRWMLKRNPTNRATAQGIVDLLCMRAPPTLASSLKPDDSLLFGRLPFRGDDRGDDRVDNRIHDHNHDYNPDHNHDHNHHRVPVPFERPPLVRPSFVRPPLVRPSFPPPPPPLDRQQDLVDDARRVAANTIRRSLFRLSMEKRRLREECPRPTDPKPLAPMDRHDQEDPRASVVKIQKAVRTSLNRRRRDVVGGTAQQRPTVPCSERLRELATPRGPRPYRPPSRPPPPPPSNEANLPFKAPRLPLNRNASKPKFGPAVLPPPAPSTRSKVTRPAWV